MFAASARRNWLLPARFTEPLPTPAQASHAGPAQGRAALLSFAAIPRLRAPTTDHRLAPTCVEPEPGMTGRSRSFPQRHPTRQDRPHLTPAAPNPARGRRVTCRLRQDCGQGGERPRLRRRGPALAPGVDRPLSRPPGRTPRPSAARVKDAARSFGPAWRPYMTRPPRPWTGSHRPPPAGRDQAARPRPVILPESPAGVDPAEPCRA